MPSIKLKRMHFPTNPHPFNSYHCLQINIIKNIQIQKYTGKVGSGKLVVYILYRRVHSPVILLFRYFFLYLAKSSRRLSFTDPKV